MASSSPERGRTRSRQHTSPNGKAHALSRTRSPHRSVSARSDMRSRPSSRSTTGRGNRRNGDHSRGNSSRRGRGASPIRQERSYSRSRSQPSPVPKSSKVCSNHYQYGCPVLNCLQLVVEKLTKNVNENHLHEIFGAYGPIKDLELPMNRQCKASLHIPNVRAYLHSHDKSRHSLHHLCYTIGRRSRHCSYA